MASTNTQAPRNGSAKSARPRTSAKGGSSRRRGAKTSRATQRADSEDPESDPSFEPSILFPIRVLRSTDPPTRQQATQLALHRACRDGMKQNLGSIGQRPEQELRDSHLFQPQIRMHNSKYQARSQTEHSNRVQASLESLFPKELWAGPGQRKAKPPTLIRSADLIRPLDPSLRARVGEADESGDVRLVGVGVHVEDLQNNVADETADETSYEDDDEEMASDYNAEQYFEGGDDYGGEEENLRDGGDSYG